MVTILLIAILGAVIGNYFNIASIALYSIIIFATQCVKIYTTGNLHLSDIFVLFAYLSAAQGGYLIGAYWADDPGR